jgi:GTP-binding protein
MKFIDTAHILVRAGDGGSGIISFRREKFVPKGGPDGGDGGRGGDVVLRANQHLTTLLDFQYRRQYRAQSGGHGSGSRKTGKGGEDTIIAVPVGTVVREGETNALLGDLTRHGQELIVARGGRAGRGNAAFATSTDQAPRHYEPGEDGEEREIDLELKLLADVGLVGLPNAGKSTLISVISAARPKIADYPFTTLVPNLGIVRVEEGRGFVVADIPGLIEGAHMGKGLGIQFLRHIERTKALVFLLDATRDDPKEDYRILLAELAAFNRDLPRRPSIIALTKMDAVPEAQLRTVARLRFGRTRIHRVSAVTRSGIADLVADMWKIIAGEPVVASSLRGRRTETRGRRAKKASR